MRDNRGALFPDDVPRDEHLVEDPSLALDQSAVRTATASPWRRALGRLRRDKPALVALVFLVGLVLLAVLAPLLMAHDPNDISSDTFASPSGAAGLRGVP